MGTPERPVRVLVIDDEEEIRRALKSVLTVRKFDVTLAVDGGTGLDAAIDCSPDLVILDLSLPDMDGLEVCRELRNWLKVPILVLSVRGEDADKIVALDLGADDYLTKPFSAGELLARIRALLRRAGQGDPAAPVIEAGDISIDVATRSVAVGGKEVTLTRTEFDILQFLAQHLDTIVTSRMLLQTVWGPWSGGDTQTLRAHISHIRKKIEANPALPKRIITEPGVGFRLTSR
jgi:two-component system, OmpR family, KDP operon response regulator KdpE